MSNVSMKTAVPVDPEKLWKTIGEFGALNKWHPAVQESAMEENGAVRRLKLVGGGEIVERLEKTGDKSYSYSIVSGPLPVQNYTSTLTVKEGADGTSTIEWSSNFQPIGPETDAMAAIRGVYEAGFKNLQKMFGQG